MGYAPRYTAIKAVDEDRSCSGNSPVHSNTLTVSAMALSLVFVLLSVTLPFIAAVPSPATTECTGTISSLSDVAAAVKCTTVNINSFTVPAGETFELDLADGTTVNMGERWDFARMNQNNTYLGPVIF